MFRHVVQIWKHYISSVSDHDNEMFNVLPRQKIRYIEYSY